MDYDETPYHPTTYLYVKDDAIVEAVKYIESKTDLTQSKVDVIEAKTDALQSKTDVIEAKTDALQSKTDVIEAKTDAIFKALAGPNADGSAYGNGLIPELAAVLRSQEEHGQRLEQQGLRLEQGALTFETMLVDKAEEVKTYIHAQHLPATRQEQRIETLEDGLTTLHADNTELKAQNTEMKAQMTEVLALLKQPPAASGAASLNAKRKRSSSSASESSPAKTPPYNRLEDVKFIISVDVIIDSEITQTYETSAPASACRNLAKIDDHAGHKLVPQILQNTDHTTVWARACSLDIPQYLPILDLTHDVDRKYAWWFDNYVPRDGVKSGEVRVKFNMWLLKDEKTKDKMAKGGYVTVEGLERVRKEKGKDAAYFLLPRPQNY